jgi:trigger factor
VKVTTDKPAPGVAALTVELPPEDLERARDQAWRRLAGRVNIPGFRRGKAPRPLVERHVGTAAIDEEALRRLLPQRYDAAVEAAGIAPIERPSFDVVQLERGKPLVFKATVAVRPTVDLGDYRSLAVDPEPVEVRDDEVERALERLRESQAQWVPVEDRGLEVGDLAIADVQIEAEPAGDAPAAPSAHQDAEIVLGESGFPAGFDQQVLGARAGETREFSLAWPPAPSGGAEQAPPARTATFRVHVKDVKRKQLPELDDAFARSLGEHETLEALREDACRRLYDEAHRAARAATETKAVDAAIERARFEIPGRLLDAETEALAQERQRALAEQRITLERFLAVTGQSEAAWRAAVREQATRQLKARLLLDQLAEQESLAVSPDEIEREIERVAGTYGEQAEQVRRSLMTDEARQRIAAALRRQRAIEKLVSFAGGYPPAGPGRRSEHQELVTAAGSATQVEGAGSGAAGLAPGS